MINKHIPTVSSSMGVAHRDPMIIEGYNIIYEEEIPLEIRGGGGVMDRESIEDFSPGGTSRGFGRFPGSSTDHSEFKTLICRVTKKGVRDNTVARIDISSDTDLFFNFYQEVDSRLFANIQADQSLMIDFPDYEEMLIGMLKNCKADPHTFLGVIDLNSDGGVRLNFVQNMEYKLVELLSVDLSSLDEMSTRERISYRYLLMRSKLEMATEKLKEVYSLIKTKNPSLLLNIQKGRV